jgi:hypothetical protein
MWAEYSVTFELKSDNLAMRHTGIGRTALVFMATATVGFGAEDAEMGRTLAFQRVANCIVLVHVEKDPTDSEWDEYVQFFASNIDTRVLVFSKGGAPSAAQRDKLKRVVDKHGKRVVTAVMTDSQLARGVMTALKWFLKDMSAFPAKDFEGALKYLEIPEGMAGLFRKSILSMSSDLGIPAG